jgi:hypothetical protein
MDEELKALLVQNEGLLQRKPVAHDRIGNGYCGSLVRLKGQLSGTATDVACWPAA